MVAASARQAPRAKTGITTAMSEMRAAAIGIVEEVDVAVLHGLGREDARISATEGIKVARWIGTARAWASVVPSMVKRTRRGVEPFLHDRRAGALQQRRLHLLGDDIEAVADHLERDRVEAVAAHEGRARSRSSAAPPATRADQPRGRSVVVASCSMIAGPAIASPAAMRARSWISVRTSAAEPGKWTSRCAFRSGLAGCRRGRRNRGQEDRRDGSRAG